jgi:uncharacterized membrane protein YeaQ/YmgE (transglycosylase-associated protein family)
MFIFDFFSFLIFLLVAAVCGSIGASIAGFSSRGCLTHIAIGLIGAIIGTWLSRELGMPELLVIRRIPILWTIVGSGLLVVLMGLISGNRRRR